MIKSIGVFCASSKNAPEILKEVATDLGQLMGRQGIELVYGGASIGLMGCVARGVHEAGGKVVGVLPKFFLNKGIDYSEADELIVTPDMRDRKTIMEKRADGFIALPGGIGTLEEAVEMLSMVQLKLIHKPLVFIDTQKFYQELLSFFKTMIKFNLVKEDALNLFKTTPEPARALDYIKSYRPPENSGNPREKII